MFNEIKRAEEELSSVRSFIDHQTSGGCRVSASVYERETALETELASLTAEFSARNSEDLLWEAMENRLLATR